MKNEIHKGGILEEILDRISNIEEKISNLESYSQKFDRLAKQIREVRDLATAPRALNVGDGLILAKLAFDNLMITVEETDRLIGPHLVMNGIYEKGLTAYFRSLIDQTSTYVDVGANIGYYTVLFGKHLRDRGQVYAFEPDERNFEILTRNLQINWIDKKNILAENFAVGSENGTADIFRHNTKPGNTSLLPQSSVGTSDISKFVVSKVTLDDYFAERDVSIDVMKVDVEGYELPVLIGAQNTIKYSPNIRLVVEWDPARWGSIDVSAQDVAELLSSLEMKAALVSSRGEVNEINYDILLDVAYANVIFCHERNTFQ